MSDYMFKLENHLSTAQGGIVAEVRSVAADSGAKVFLTGGAVRDMFGGFAIRDLDFTIEGDALKVAKMVAERVGAEILHTDATRKKVDLLSPQGVTFEISMAREERYPKIGSKPQVTPSTVYEDLRRATSQSIPLGCHSTKRPRGLLIDPTKRNGRFGTAGAAFVQQHRVLRCPSSPHAAGPIPRSARIHGGRANDEPSSQRAGSGLEEYISRDDVLTELRAAAREPNIADLLEAWQKEGYLGLYHPPCRSAAEYAKLRQAAEVRESLPFGLGFYADEVAVLFWLLTEKLTPKERAAIAQLDG
jgi:hypothetical protein